MKDKTYWRDYARDRKARLVVLLGGACARCGYDKCIGALHFHHLDPTTKSFTISHTYNTAWRRLVNEAMKCELLCANCHAEEHEDGKSHAALAEESPDT